MSSDKPEVTLRPREKGEHEAHMTRAEFLNCVLRDLFTDDDGYGELATAEQVSDVVVSPSEASDIIRKHPWATHVVWYNR